MTLIVIKLLVDSFMILLLGATIFYCFLVNRRIRVLQDSKQDFAQLIQKFDDTTRKAQESIEELQKVSGHVTESLNERLDKANFLADDLAFMIEKGNKVADKVDKSMPQQDRSALAPKREPMIGRNKSEGASSNAKNAMAKATAANKGDGARNAKRDKVESMLERLGDKSASPTSRRAGGRASARLRSKAEKDLQNAIKSSTET